MWLNSCFSVAKLCLTLWDPMDHSTAGFPVFHHLLELAQTHVRWLGAIRPPYPFSSPSPPAFNLSQCPGIFQGVGSSHQVVKLLELQFQLLLNIQGWFPLGLTGFISLLFKGLSRVFFSTTVWKHQFYGAQPSLWSTSHICIWLLEKPASSEPPGKGSCSKFQKLFSSWTR